MTSPDTPSLRIGPEVGARPAAAVDVAVLHDHHPVGPGGCGHGGTDTPWWLGADGRPDPIYFRRVADRLEALLGVTFDEDPASWHEGLDVEVPGSSWRDAAGGGVEYMIAPHLYRDAGLPPVWDLGIVLRWEPREVDDPAQGWSWWYRSRSAETLSAGTDGVVAVAGTLDEVDMFAHPALIAEVFVAAVRDTSYGRVHATRIVAEIYQPLTVGGLLASIAGVDDPGLPAARPWLFARCTGCGWVQGFGPDADPADLAEAGRIHDTTADDAD